MLKFCMSCGGSSNYHDQKCSKCGTAFGSVIIETKSSESARPIVVEKSKPKFPKLLDPSLFDDETLESEYDFSCLAADLEQELELGKNGAIKNLKTIKGADLFRKENQ